jgi:hypothetical protein
MVCATPCSQTSRIWALAIDIRILIWRIQRFRRWKRALLQSDHLSKETERCITFARAWWASTLVTNPDMLSGHPRTSEILTDLAMQLAWPGQARPDPNRIRRFQQLPTCVRILRHAMSRQILPLNMWHSESCVRSWQNLVQLISGYVGKIR